MLCNLSYWKWVYYLNIFAWALRGLAVNEFASGKYDSPSEIPGLTQGEVILSRFGFVDSNDDPYSFVWAWWAILYNSFIFLLAVVATSLLYRKIRFATGRSLDSESGSEAEDQEEEMLLEPVQLPFQKVDLTFKDIHYTVTSSVGNEKLELLKGISGIVEAGKMTALVSENRYDRELSFKITLRLRF